MTNDTSFQEMMRRYNRELMRLQKKAAGRSPDESCDRPAPPAPRMEPELPPVTGPDLEPDCPPAPCCDCCEPKPCCDCREPEPCGPVMCEPIPPVCEECRFEPLEPPACTSCCPEETVPESGSERRDCDLRDCPVERVTDHSQTVGVCGPVLLQDTLLHERLETFVHREILERPIHIKGYGALGCFQPYSSMAEYTCACFLQDPCKKTPVLVRFSQAGSNRGSPDTARDIRGFATKFYTDDGIFDIVGNHIPVFFVRDAMRFPETIAALSPSPVNNLPDPERFWSFMARTPEATHMLTWLYSDLGTVDSYRHIRGYGINTFVWKNADGVRRYVKYHWLPAAGERCITRQEAVRLAGENPDIAGEDLYTTIAAGGKVEYELCIQLMDPEDACKLPFDPLDDTKYWPESVYPLQPVGRMTLDRNPDCYNDQVEKAAFSPANLIPGIELSDDRMLQGRSFIYWDSQRRRLGPDFRKIPVNCTPNWSPEKMLITSGEGVQACGPQVREAAPKPDNFTQAGERYRGLSATGQEHLIDNIASELYMVSGESQRCVLDYLRKADELFADRVSKAMAEYAAGRK